MEQGCAATNPNGDHVQSWATSARLIQSTVATLGQQVDSLCLEDVEIRAQLQKLQTGRGDALSEPRTEPAKVLWADLAADDAEDEVVPWSQLIRRQSHSQSASQGREQAHGLENGFDREKSRGQEDEKCAMRHWCPHLTSRLRETLNASAPP